MVEQMEVWSSVLLPYLSEDNLIGRLWVCSSMMRQLIKTKLRSLIVHVHRYRKNDQSTTPGQKSLVAWYARPSFLSQLQHLKSLEIVVPEKDAGPKNQVLGWEHILPVEIFEELPSSLNFFEVNLPMMRDGASKLFVTRCAVWLMEHPNLIIGPKLSRSLSLQSMVYSTLLSLTVESITNAEGNCGAIAHQLTYLVGSGMEELVKVLEDPLGKVDPTRLAEIASRITTVHAVVKDLNLVYHLRHFSNLKELKVHSANKSNYYTLRRFMEVPPCWIWPSSLTDLFIVTNEIPWPTSWPAGLISLRITTSVVGNEEYNKRIRLLPSSLQVLNYHEKQSGGSIPFSILDQDSVAALPRSLTKLSLPSLPVGCFNQNAKLWYSQLPSGLQFLSEQYGNRVWLGMTSEIFSIIPCHFPSLVVTTGEPMLDYAPWGTAFYMPTFNGMRNIPTILRSFTDLIELDLIITSFSHTIPNLPDTIISLNIQYLKGLQIDNNILMSEKIRWPFSLRYLKINYVNHHAGLGSDTLSLRQLEGLPNHVRSIVINMRHDDVKIINPPPRWPQELQELQILTRYTKDLMEDVALRPEAWPNRDVVNFKMN